MSRTMNLAPALASVGLTSRIKVSRRVEVVNNFGESNTSNWVVDRVPACVFVDGQNKLDRRPEAQSTERSIGIITRFSLRVAGADPQSGKTWQADVVTWEGNEYTVIMANPWGNVGCGYVEAMAVARPTVAVAPQTRPANAEVAV